LLLDFFFKVVFFFFFNLLVIITLIWDPNDKGTKIIGIFTYQQQYYQQQ